MNTPTRDQLRRQIRQRRRQQSLHDWRQNSLRLSQRILTLPHLRSAEHIGLFLSNDGEPDLRALSSAAWRRKRSLYLPVLSPLFHNRLWFAPYTPHTALQANRFRIPEPCNPWPQMKPVWALDLILMPLVAFDSSGNRLGMGGGFYDRTLAYLNRRNHWRKPTLIGVAFEFQQVDSLPYESWDIPLDGVITEKGFYG